MLDSYRRWLAEESDTSRAGVRLRAWLERENPLASIAMPGYASDRIDATRDLIGIRVEADALAYLIASRDVRPPLAIGLFGDWGSGKSFLMRSVQQRIRDLEQKARSVPQGSVPVWRNVRQIEFNAWEYVQGNLWAGLLERIFRELGSGPSAGILETRQAPVREERQAQAEIIKATGKTLADLKKQRAGRETELGDAELKAAAARSAAAEVHSGAAGVARTAALGVLRQVWTAQRVGILGATGTDLVDALVEAKAEVGRGRALLGPFWTPGRIALVSLGVLVIPLVALALAALDAPPVVTVLGGLVPLVPLVTTALRASTQWTAKVLAEIEKADAQVRAATGSIVAEAEAEVDQARRQVREVDERRAATEAEAKGALVKQAQLDATLAALTPARVLAGFADERSSDYRHKLGPLSRIRRDLDQLQDEVIKANAAAVEGCAAPSSDMPNRVVLYIDDLDRCPPENVVEVLEAVHLLLAFELFVVVVAVDSRWLSFALTDQLIALRPKSPGEENPTPQNYLEKIFQLPFWVQPLSPPARGQLVNGLLAASVRSRGDAVDPVEQAGLTIGEGEQQVLETMVDRRGSDLRLETSPLALSLEDLAFLESLAPLLGDTPRRIKRFVNTCQLLLAMPPTLPVHGESPNQREIVCFLAAVGEGLPSVAGPMFAGIRAAFAGTLAGSSAGWGLGAESARLTEWLDKRTAWAALPLARLDVRLDMVDRLAFASPRLGSPRA